MTTWLFGALANKPYKLNSFSFSQHDLHFPSYITPHTTYKYKYQLPPGEQFFIRKFNGDLDLTSEQLREKEYELASTLLSSSSKVDWGYHIRDYYTLCRGGNVAIVFKHQFINNIHCDLIFNTKIIGEELYAWLIHFQVFESDDIVQTDPLQERCFFAHNNDPYLYISPLKLEVVMESPLQLYIYHGAATFHEINQVKAHANIQVIIW